MSATPPNGQPMMPASPYYGGQYPMLPGQMMPGYLNAPMPAPQRGATQGANPADVLERSNPKASRQQPVTFDRIQRGAQDIQQKTERFFQPNQQGQPWYQDKQKLTTLAIGVGGVLTLGLVFGLVGRKPQPLSEMNLGQRFRQLFGKEQFTDKKQAILDKFHNGFSGLEGWNRRQMMKRKMGQLGGTAYLKTLRQQVRDSGGNVIKRNRRGEEFQHVLRELENLWIIKHDILKDPKAAKEFHFDSASQAAQQLHVLMQDHLETLQKMNKGFFKGANYRQEIETYMQLSQHMLERYIVRHGEDAANYPITEGFTNLMKMTTLKQAGYLQNRGRHDEALELIRKFLTVASGEVEDIGDNTAASPQQMMSNRELADFLTLLRKTVNSQRDMTGDRRVQRSIQRIRFNASAGYGGNAGEQQRVVRALNDLMDRLPDSAFENGKQDALEKAVDELLSSSSRKGATFKILHEVLDAVNHTIPTFSEM